MGSTLPFRLLLNALLAAAGLLLSCGAAYAQQTQLTVQNATFGTINAAAVNDTTFKFAAADGAVTSLSGTGTRVTQGPVRAAVAIKCGSSGNASYCGNQNVLLTLTRVGTPSGRARALSNFTVAVSGTSVVVNPSGTNTVTLTVAPWGSGNNIIVYIGGDFTVRGDNESLANTASAGWMLTMSRTNGNNAVSANGTVGATIRRSLGIAKQADLSFGKIIRPASGNGSVALAASTGNQSPSGGVVWLTTPTPTRAQFRVTGEPGQVVSISVPGSFSIARPQGETLLVTTSNTGSGNPQLPTSGANVGAFTFYVGGFIPVNSTTPPGVYSGTFQVSAAYN